MKNNNILQTATKIHFIGIGGISQSALAKLMLSKNKIVTGSDLNKSHITRELQNLGIHIFYAHKRSNLTGCDLVVYTGAVKNNNKELLEAKKQNIKTLERSEFLGLVAAEYKNIIAIAGTHGKTTTCGMLASIFKSAGLKPTVHIGGESEDTNGNLLIGNNEFFITEACEYKNSYLTLNQNVGIILNIENDHTDCFKGLKDVYASFSKFYNNSKNLTIINEKHLIALNKKHENYKTFSEKMSKGYYAKNIKTYKNGNTNFYVYNKGKFVGRFVIKSPLKHNVYNALSAIIVSLYYKIPISHIKTGLKNFKGIKRRLEVVGEVNGASVIHDYAHHPTEIKSTIESIKKQHKKEVVCVFQPHTYSRTKSLMKDFLKCFKLCNKVIINKTYAAREKYNKSGSGKTLNKNLKFVGVKSTYIKDYSKIKKYLVKTVKKNQIVLILGAGSIEDLAYKYF